MAAMTAFAANSVLCRIALSHYAMDAYMFTAWRLISGALVLFPLLVWQRKNMAPWGIKSFLAGLALFAYAVLFSLAYVQLNTATGALLLFAAVQVTMISVGLAQGSRLPPLQWAGIVLAMGGLLYLLLPTATGPTLSGAILMMLSGMAWGAYSVLGKAEPAPSLATARNFMLAAPLGVIALLFQGESISLGHPALLLALLSGGVTSGLGYLLWYRLVKLIPVHHAAVLQLSVPALAALGGVVFAEEVISLQMALASGIILTGIFITTQRSTEAKQSIGYHPRESILTRELE